MSESNSTAGGGIGITGALGITFLVLKLTRVIDWSWAWVLSPFWIPFAVAIPLVAILLVTRK